MTTRTFDRQVRPVRLHLSVDRNHFLCGYVQRPTHPQPDLASTPLCGPCFVAFHLLHAQMQEAIRSCAPPDVDLTTAVALLQETEWGPRLSRYDLAGWARACEGHWARMWGRK